MGGGRGARDGGYLKNLTSNKYLDRGVGAFCLGGGILSGGGGHFVLSCINRGHLVRGGGGAFCPGAFCLYRFCDI